MSITKQEIERIAKTQGEVRGSALVTDMNYILQKKGEEGLKRLEEKIKEWGYNIDYRNIKNMGWYSVGLRLLSLLAVKEVFGWDEKDIRNMGYSAPAYSFTLRLVMRYFLTLKKTYQMASSVWKKHYTIGRLETPEFHETEKEKYIILRVYDFKIHPIFCPYYAGYFLRAAELSVSSKEKIIGIEETKCMFKGDAFHEFKVRWE